MKIFIPGEFTTLNDFIVANNSSKFAANEIKQTETMRAKFAALEFLSDPKNEPIVIYPVQIEFLWFRKNKLTDPDNIAFAAKYILDGLVQAHMLVNDNWTCIKSISHEFKIDHVIQGVQIWLYVTKIEREIKIKKESKRGK